MKLTVLIERRQSGPLSAYVVQEHQRGSNLLRGHQISDVNSAKLKAQNRIAQDTGQLVEITWEGVQE
jgi:hypothetical protein